MTMTQWIRSLAGLAGLFAAGFAAAAEDAGPKQLLEDGVDEVMALVYDTPPTAEPLSVRARPVLAKYFDYEGVTRRAIGPGWRSFSPEQRERTVDLFTQLVLRTYADSFKPGERPQISFGSEVPLSETRRELPSNIVYAGETYSVTYRMQRLDEGWRIYDVIIEGVSMISNYRAQFDEILQRGGPEDVLSTLEQKLKEVPPPEE